MMTRASRRRMGRSFFYVLVAAIIVYTVFPFYWAVISSLKSGQQLFGTDLVPPSPTLDNYVSVFREQPFLTNIVNSLIVAGSTVLICLALSVSAAYALGRVRFRGRSTILMLTLAVSM